MARQRTRRRLVSFLVALALVAPAITVLPVVGRSRSVAVAQTTSPVTVTRVDSSVQVTPDASGRVTIPYCPAADPCAFASPPAGVVVTGRSPTGGPGIPANLVAYDTTTTGFTLRALDQGGNEITTPIEVFYHAASDLTADEEVRTVTVTTNSSGYATVGYASPRVGLVPAAVVASGVSPDGGGNIPVHLVVSGQTDSGFTVRALNQSGLAIASASVTLSYHAAWAGRIDPGTGWVAANATTTTITTDPEGYATVSFPQALPAAPTGIVASGVSPASGDYIAASLLAHSPTATSFRVRVLNHHGDKLISKGVRLSYHAVAGTRSQTALTLLPPRLVRSNGAELRWTRAAGASFGRYAVHRSTTWGFPPQASTLLTTISDPTASEWQDTTAAASKTYYYKVVGDTTVSNQATAATPAAGNATLTVQPDAAAGKATYLARDTLSPVGCYDWNNYGAAQFVRIGAATNGVVHRPLLAFDLRDIPAGANVSAATLTLAYPTTSATGKQLDLHRVTRAWREGNGAYPGQCNGSGADWNETQGGVRWSASGGGGDFDPTEDATLPAKTRDSAGQDSFNVLNLVREWASGAAPNHGMLLKLRDETIPTSGSTYFDYHADDHTTASERPKLTVTYADGSASISPRVALSAPAPGATVSGNQVPLKATAGDDRRVDKVDFLVDGAQVASDTAPPFEATWNSTSVAKGTHTITARASDDAGNPPETSAGVQVTVDNSSPPTGSLTAPAAGATVSGTAVTLSATATGNGDQVKQVEFLVDGVRVGAPDTSFPYSIAWNTLAPLATSYDGSHQLQALVTETSGQSFVTAARTITVNNRTTSQYQASLKLNVANADTTDDGVVPQLMPENGSSTAPLQDPYAGTTNPDGTSGGSRGVSITSAPESPMSPAQAGFTASATCPAEAYCPTVTVKNESGVAWRNNTGLDLRVWYRWYAPNGAVLFEGPAADNFPNNFPAGEEKDFPLEIQPPRLPPGAELGEYRLRIDLYDLPTATWFAARGNPPIDHPILVAKSLEDRLGLERFWQYDGEDVGAGMSTLTNVANGNMLLRWSPFFAPGRGLATMVDLTYNSLEDHSESPAGENFSLAISGLTRLGAPLDIHPNKADDVSGKSNKWVEFIDGDGTTHRFVGTTQSGGSTRWQEPPGVNLYLRETGSPDPARKWALTRPDKVTFYFDQEGFPRSVVDRNGNPLTFTLEDTPSADDPGGPKKRITQVTDAGQRNFTIDYWTKDEAKKAHVRGKIQRIADHNGSALDFDYYDDGNLLRLTQRGGVKANGEHLPDRSFVFTYTTSSGAAPAIGDPDDRDDPDPKTANQSTRIFSVRDPNQQETTFTYYGPSDGAQLRWKLQRRINRTGNTLFNRLLDPNPYRTSFAYDLTNRVTTVTAPLSRTTRYAYDTDGKVTRITDPLNQPPTQVEWTPDFKVSKVTEPTGKFSTYTYNANGYLTSQQNQITTRVERTELTYTDSAVDAADTGNHLSLLATVTTPKGVATATAGDFQWRYSYDGAGNPDKVTDPTGAVTDYDYNLAGSANPGTVNQVRDAKGNPPTTFPTYDPSGQPTEIRDPLGNTTRFGYDPDGLLRWIQDPNHAADSGTDERSYKSFLDYDSFHRLGRQSAPKSTATARGKLIWSGADFDANDNAVRLVDPHEGFAVDDAEAAPTSTASYDVMDRPLLVANSDTSVDPQGERTSFEYDTAGRLKKTTAPKGVLSATDDDHTTVLDYDPLDRITRQTTYGTSTSASQTRKTHLCYDLAGDLRSVTAPRALRDTVTCPGTGPLTGVGFTATFDYDAAHRQVASRDPLGHERRTGYDANGNVDSQEADIASGRVARTAIDYDQRDLPVTITQRFDGTAGRNVVSRIEYDPNGNRSRLISPRANDAAGGTGPYTHYVTSYGYDAVNRLTRITLPFDTDDGTERQYVHNAYDANGNLEWTSLPVTHASPGSVQATAKTVMSHFDPGWVRTSDDPANPKVAFDYTAQGWQARRVPERNDTSSIPDDDRRMLWAYFNDGQLKQRSDQGGHPSTYTWDANNNLTGALDAAGVTDPGEQPVQTEATWTGFDEPAKVRHRRQAAATWRFTDYTYDENGNTKVRRENGEERASDGVQTVAPRRHELSYDQADWLTQQLDLGTDGTCNQGDRRITNSFWATGWEHQRDIDTANSACSWSPKQTTTWTHFDNGKLKKLDTLAYQGATGVLTESHDVGYLDNGVYVNGHRTSDHYLLKRKDGDTATTCVSAAAACDARWSYDARDRLVHHQQRAGTATTYTLDQPAQQQGDTAIRAGNVTTENDGTKTLVRRYLGNQLTELAVDGTTAAKYWYDSLGNLDCVTRPAGGQGDCSPSDGPGASANLLVDHAYDYLDRLAASRSYAGAASPTDKAGYTYDALDRVTKEVEDHTGTGKDRTTTFTHQGLSSLVTEERQSGGTDPQTKTFSYDAYGHRLAMTSVPTGGGTPEAFTYGHDVHGSVSQLLSTSGTVRASYGYSAYGGADQALTTGDSDAQAPVNPYRYAGKRLDSGLATSAGSAAGYDMGARRYGPDTGRFLQQDLFHAALGDLGLALDPLTQNRYALAGGNPVSYVEWDGHAVFADGYGAAARSPTPSRRTNDPSTWIGNLTPEQGKELARQFGLPADVGESLEKAFGEAQRTNLCMDDDISEVFGNERGDPVLRLNCGYNASAWTIQPTPNGLVLSPTSAPYLSSSGGGTTGGRRGPKGWTDNPELFKGEKPPTNRFGLYALFDRATGKFLKWGITADPTTRYPGGKIPKREGGPIEITMSMVLHFPAKNYYVSETMARKWETWLVERFPGPRNREAWRDRVTPTETDLMALQMLLQQMP
jgi:RHS repeat-associated protein